MNKKIIVLCSIIVAIYLNGYGQNDTIVNVRNIVSNNEKILIINNKDHITLNSHDNTFEFNAKNVIIAIAGADAISSGSASINFERFLFTNHSINYLLNVGYGMWYSIAKDYNSNTLLYYSRMIPVSINILTGIENNHLEINLGTSILLNETYTTDYILTGPPAEYPNPKYSKFILLANIGYRYQRPQGGFVFKFYLGLTGFGIGLGSAF